MNNHSIINLTRLKKCSLQNKLLIMRACIESLSQCHHDHLLHRDIQPRHFILDLKNNSLILRDSGYMVRENWLGFYASKLLVGSPDYIAPELNENKWIGWHCRYSRQTDIYALGVTFASLLQLKLESLRTERAIHMRDTFFNFVLQSRYNGNKDEARIYTSIIKIVLAMTDDTPGRRPLLSSVLHAVNVLLERFPKEANASSPQVMR